MRCGNFERRAAAAVASAAVETLTARDCNRVVCVRKNCNILFNYGNQKITYHFVPNPLYFFNPVYQKFFQRNKKIFHHVNCDYSNKKQKREERIELDW